MVFAFKAIYVVAQDHSGSWAPIKSSGIPPYVWKLHPKTQAFPTGNNIIRSSAQISAAKMSKALTDSPRDECMAVCICILQIVIVIDTREPK